MFAVVSVGVPEPVVDRLVEKERNILREVLQDAIGCLVREYSEACSQHRSIHPRHLPRQPNARRETQGPRGQETVVPTCASVGNDRNRGALRGAERG